MKALRRTLLLVLFSMSVVMPCSASGPPAGTVAGSYPKIVVYTAWYCSSCKAAGEYLAKNRIPYVKKDVDLNDEYMEELEKKYRINAVPVIVIGNNDRVLRGFTKDAFDSALKEVMAKAK